MTLEVAEGTLYPVLHRLEKAGLIASHWEMANGRRRRVYAASPRSQPALEEYLERWRRLRQAIDAVFMPVGEGSAD